jgi:hypothetical protein
VSEDSLDRKPPRSEDDKEGMLDMLSVRPSIEAKITNLMPDAKSIEGVLCRRRVA